MNPNTDKGKASKKGLLWVDADFTTHASLDYNNWKHAPSLLKEVFRDGEIL